jgi:hypothetical protein
MKEFHSSVSAIGNHLDAQEENRTANWLRAHLPSLASETPPSEADRRTEEAMHLNV